MFDINHCKNRFSNDTADFAQKAADQVCYAARIPLERENTDITGSYSGIPETKNIDMMEGHDFEYWCAELLKKKDFQNVEVTKGSGDQGVDILAEKGGVRYAIQCKCYSKDLGNTPVQEVEAGRIYYGCHVGAVMTNRYFIQGAKDLARKTGTLLWDRDFLVESLRS